MEFLLMWSVLPALVAFGGSLAILNRERARATAWGDAFLRALTRGVLLFAIVVLAEIAIWLLGSILAS